jgi:hypothetical protein
LAAQATHARHTIMPTKGGACDNEGCGKVGKLCCGGCKTVNYCSPECQREDWKRPGGHKQQCKLIQQKAQSVAAQSSAQRGAPSADGGADGGRDKDVEVAAAATTVDPSLTDAVSTLNAPQSIRNALARLMSRKPLSARRKHVLDRLPTIDWPRAVKVNDARQRKYSGPQVRRRIATCERADVCPHRVWTCGPSGRPCCLAE